MLKNRQAPARRGWSITIMKIDGWKWQNLDGMRKASCTYMRDGRVGVLTLLASGYDSIRLDSAADRSCSDRFPP